LFRSLLIAVFGSMTLGVMASGLSPEGAARDVADARARASAQAPAAGSFSASRAVLTEYCVPCHNDRLKTGGLVLELDGIENPGARAEVWEKVILRLRTGSMPPAGRPRPDRGTYHAVASLLEREIDRAAAAAPNPGRLPALHRLNRTEYRSAVRDLLALDGVDVELLLPADDSSYGFDNIADALWISPAHLERYMAAAKKISRQAVGDVSAPVSRETYSLPLEKSQDDRFEELPIGTRGGLLIRRDFPVDAEYQLTVELAGRPRTPEAHELELTVDGERVHVFSVGGPRPAARGGPPMPAQGDPDVRLPIKGGHRTIGISFVKKTSAEPEDLLQPFLRPETGVLLPQPAIGSLTITGPFGAAAGDTPSRKRVFVCRPASDREQGRCARTILSALARRAYRREVTDRDLEPLLSLYESGRAEAGFERGIQRAIERLLVSPSFLFRIERNPSSRVARISDVELASRLSFFLWSSVPDEPLLELAIRGQLNRPAVLEREVGRMLADPKAAALAVNFAGQWLHLRNVAGAAPNRLLFPDFDEGLRQAFQRETELFFESNLRERRSVLELLNADYTFVNERLARHYGIPNVYGGHFRRIAIADPNRRGLLGQGSILTLTAYSTRTSPVMRGKWILENLLGAPPPPPPPDIPALVTERPVTGEKLSMRDAMVRHRADPGCAGCHARMDPLGFALEHFNAVGQWRNKSEDGTAIDASGTLPNGVTFDGAAGLRAVLLAEPDQFVRTLTEKLLTYALGRGVEYSDAPAIRRIVREAERDRYTLAALIQGIVTSTPFQHRMRSTP
jgi:hypothetical protein